MRRLFAVLAIVLIAGACQWDGPPRDVRVVTSDPVDDEPSVADPPSPTRSPGVGTPGASGQEGGQGEAQSAPGLEDRPGPFGVLDAPGTVAVVGDSLTVAATDEITEALSRIGVRVVLVDGRERRRMTSGSTEVSSGVSAIEDILDEHRPDLWVVALGTNDVGAEVGTDRFRTDVRETLRSIPPGAPVVWVDVWIRDRLDDVVVANAVLHDELAGRAAPTSVVDWFSSGTIDGLVTGDGVHLTETGQARFAAGITDAVVALAISTG